MRCEQSWRSHVRRPRFMAFFGVLATTFLGTAAGCNALLDKSADQCVTDADCVHFGGHPYCRESVCVVSHLGPEACIPGPPKTQRDSLTSCSTSTFEKFDTSPRLGLKPTVP